MVYGFGLMVYGFGFMIYRLGFMVYGFGFMVCRFGFVVCRFGFMVYWFWFMIHRLWFVVDRFGFMILWLVETEDIFQTASVGRFGVSGDRIVVVMDRGRWGEHHYWSCWLMRMMDIMMDVMMDVMMDGYVMGSMVMQSCVMVHHMVLDDRYMMVSVTMNLMMFLVDCVMSPMVGHPVTDVVCGGGDGHVVVS